MKYVVDTCVINMLVDGAIIPETLPRDGEFAATHIQRDELTNTRDPNRRAKLLEKFSDTIDEIIPTESFVLGTSKLAQANLSDGLFYEAIKAALDEKNGGKRNNLQDALIADVAAKNYLRPIAISTKLLTA
jgi:hypothetical protein